MTKINPEKLLETLSILLTPKGGIKSEDVVDQLIRLMQKYSKKLVSRTIYVQILKATSEQHLLTFLTQDSWRLLWTWFENAIRTKNWAECGNLIQLFGQCPMMEERFRGNWKMNQILNQIMRFSWEDRTTKNMAIEICGQFMSLMPSGGMAVGEGGIQLEGKTMSEHIIYQGKHIGWKTDFHVNPLDLPAEVWLSILLYLPFPDLKNVTLVSRSHLMSQLAQGSELGMVHGAKLWRKKKFDSLQMTEGGNIEKLFSIPRYLFLESLCLDGEHKWPVLVQSDFDALLSHLNSGLSQLSCLNIYIAELKDISSNVLSNIVVKIRKVVINYCQLTKDQVWNVFNQINQEKELKLKDLRLVPRQAKQKRERFDSYSGLHVEGICPKLFANAVSKLEVFCISEITANQWSEVCQSIIRKENSKGPALKLLYVELNLSVMFVICPQIMSSALSLVEEVSIKITPNNEDDFNYCYDDYETYHIDTSNRTKEIFSKILSADCLHLKYLTLVNFSFKDIGLIGEAVSKLHDFSLASYNRKPEKDLEKEDEDDGDDDESDCEDEEEWCTIRLEAEYSMFSSTQIANILECGIKSKTLKYLNLGPQPSDTIVGIYGHKRTLIDEAKGKMGLKFKYREVYKEEDIYSSSEFEEDMEEEGTEDEEIGEEEQDTEGDEEDE